MGFFLLYLTQQPLKLQGTTKEQPVYVNMAKYLNNGISGNQTDRAKHLLPRITKAYRI